MGFFRAGRSAGRQVGSVARRGWYHDPGICAGALLPRSHWQPERIEDHDSGQDTTTQTGGLFSERLSAEFFRQKGVQAQSKAPTYVRICILPADDMGVVGHTQRTQTSMSPAK